MNRWRPARLPGLPGEYGDAGGVGADDRSGVSISPQGAIEIMDRTVPWAVQRVERVSRLMSWTATGVREPPGWRHGGGQWIRSDHQDIHRFSGRRSLLHLLSRACRWHPWAPTQIQGPVHRLSWMSTSRKDVTVKGYCRGRVGQGSRASHTVSAEKAAHPFISFLSEKSTCSPHPGNDSLRSSS